MTFVQYSKMACDLISGLSWLRSKTYVLAGLWDIQIQSRNLPVTIICTVITRWTVHCLAFRHLLELKLPLWALVNQDAMASSGQQILIPLGSTAANKRKARKMVAIIKNPTFWHSLDQYAMHYLSFYNVIQYMFNTAWSHILSPLQEQQMLPKQHSVIWIKHSLCLACFPSIIKTSWQRTQSKSQGVQLLLTALRSSEQRQTRTSLLQLLFWTHL